MPSTMIEKIEQLAEFVEQDIPVLADMDDCLIGVINRRDSYYAVYSRSKIVRKLMNDNGWSYLDAVEWFEFNIQCAYAGKQTPLYLIDEFPDGVECL